MYVHKCRKITSYVFNNWVEYERYRYVTLWRSSYALLYFAGDRALDTVRSDSSGSSSVAVAVITFAVTFIVSVTATAIITFIVAYVCVKRTFEKANNTHNPNEPMPQENVLYEQVCIPNKTITKNDLELQPDPAYATTDKVIMDTNPVYETYM